MDLPLSISTLMIELWSKRFFVDLGKILYRFADVQFLRYDIFNGNTPLLLKITQAAKLTYVEHLVLVLLKIRLIKISTIYCHTIQPYI